MTNKTNYETTPYNQSWRIHDYLVSRSEDAARLFAMILECNRLLPVDSNQRLGGDYKTIANLDYCTVAFDARVEPSAIANRYCVTGDNGVIFYCDDLSHVVETILRKWW